MGVSHKFYSKKEKAGVFWKLDFLNQSTTFNHDYYDRLQLCYHSLNNSLQTTTLILLEKNVSINYIVKGHSCIGLLVKTEYWSPSLYWICKLVVVKELFCCSNRTHIANRMFFVVIVKSIQINKHTKKTSTKLFMSVDWTFYTCKKVRPITCCFSSCFLIPTFNNKNVFPKGRTVCSSFFSMFKGSEWRNYVWHHVGFDVSKTFIIQQCSSKHWMIWWVLMQGECLSIGVKVTNTCRAKHTFFRPRSFLKLTIDYVNSDRVRFCIGRCAGELSRVVQVSLFYKKRADQLTPALFRDLHTFSRSGLTQPIESLTVKVPENGSWLATACACSKVNHAGQFDPTAPFHVNFFVVCSVNLGFGLCKES